MSSRMDAMEPTLLPYLDSRSPGIAIRFGDTGRAPVPGTTPATASGNYTTLRWGRAVVDGKSPIAEFAILCQADCYGDGDSRLNPITNVDVERHWQATLGRYAVAQDSKPSGLPFLRADAKGWFRPWRPLFHCSHIDVYCHPLCPHCGGELTLCLDEVLLQEAGLPVYSDSLKRFLYCPPCHAAGDASDFYSRSPMANPPANVRHGRYLVENFSRLLAKTALADALPCIDCRHAAECYGPDALALKRMRPFQFYPFHMLVQPAPDIHAVDFIGLLSGADPEALSNQIGQQPDRERWTRFSAMLPELRPGSGFLFASDPINFPEILYLKLSLLRELYTLWTHDRSTPAQGVSIEDVWVKLGGQSTGMPWLWNFALQSIDPFGRPAKQVPGADNANDDWHERFAEAWFYVLVVNPRQNMAVVKSTASALASTIEQVGSLDLQAADGVFSAGNICWPEPSPEMTPEWESLWRETIQFGLNLMPPRPEHVQDADKTMAAEISDLKLQARDALFRQGRTLAQAGSMSDLQAEDRRIGDIIAAIARQWSTPGEPRSAAKPAALPVETASILRAGQPNEDGDYEETVILAPGEMTAISPEPDSAAPSPEPDLDKTLVQSTAMPSRENENLDETVVIRPQEESEARPDLEATLVMAPRKDPARHIHPGKTIGIRSTMGVVQDDDPEKTMVISPKGVSPGAQTPLHRAKTVAEPPAADDALEKTMVIAPGKGPAADRQDDPAEDPGPPIDEDLPETVIIQPRGHKNGKT